MGFSNGFNLRLRETQNMQLLFRGIQAGLGHLEIRLSGQEILLGAHTPVKKPLLALMADLGQLEVRHGLVKLGLGVAHFLALECDKLLALFNPISDPDVDLSDACWKGIGDNGHAVLGRDHLSHGGEAGLEGLVRHEGGLDLNRLLFFGG